MCVDAGKKDGIRVGDLFAISRKWGRYVGRIRITELDDNISVGLFEAGSAGDAAPPLVNDDAFPTSE